MTVFFGVIFLAQSLASAAQTPRDLERQIQQHDQAVRQHLTQMDTNRVLAVQELKEEFGSMRDELKPSIGAVVTELRLLRETIVAERVAERVAGRADELDKVLGIALKIAGFVVGSIWVGRQARSMVNGRKHTT